MTAPIDIRKIFPSYELLTAGNSPDADPAQAESDTTLDPVAPTGTATQASGAVTGIAVDNAGKFLTVAPKVTVAAPAGGASVAQVNSSVTATVGSTPANGKKLTIDGTDITFGDMAQASADIRTDILASSQVVAVPSSTEITIGGGYLANDVQAAGAVQTLDFAGMTASTGAYNADLTAEPVTINGGSGTGLSLTVDTNGAGDITAVNVVNPGSGYAANDTITIAAGGSIGGTAGTDDITIDVATVSASAFSLSINDFDDNTVVFTAGVDFNPNGLNRADLITALQTAISGKTEFSASVTANGVKVEHVVPTNGTPSTGDNRAVAKANDTNNRFTVANFSGAVDPVAAGDANDDLAATIAAYIRANVADFSAETNGATITISYTGSNGTDPSSVVGDTKTASFDGAGATIAISNSGNFSGGAVEYRTATATAALYAQTDATNRGTIETITMVDNGSGYAATPIVTIDSPVGNKNVVEQIAKLGADKVTGSNTFAYDKNYVAIALEDFDIDNNQGNLANPLSSAEADETTGDFRKLVYHVLRTTHKYLDQQEGVDTITVTNGGSGYASTDTVAITGGGGSGATATLVLGGSSNDIVQSVNVTNAGSGYTTTPVATITTSTGSNAVLAVNLTDNTPEKFSISKGFLSENTATDEVSRDYTASFTFDEAGLEMSAES